jgi:hypothetical protein
MFTPVVGAMVVHCGHLRRTIASNTSHLIDSVPALGADLELAEW